MRDKLRRLGWLSLVMLFIFTGIGVGVYGFWQSTHQSKSDSQTVANSCSFSGSVTESALPLPEAYKPESEITKLSTSDLEPGSGPDAKPGQCLIVKYYGTLTDGTVFDENYDKPTGLQFQLGQGTVIPGWDEGLVGMKAGGTRRLLIPSSLAYGSQAQGPIPANSNLVFVVHLISLK